MGDADVSQDRPTDDDIENLLDEALTELDDEMNRMFTFLNLLNTRTSINNAKLMSLVSTWQKFRLCFTALNLFITPIVLSIGIIYGCIGWVTTGSVLQTGLEMFIPIAMGFSLSLGLPLYAFALWVFFINDEVEDFLLGSTKATNSPLDDRDEPSIESLEESVETINIFRAFSRVRGLANNAEMDRGMEDEQERDDSEESDGFVTLYEEMPATFNNEVVKNARQQLIEFESDDSLTDPDTDASRSETEEIILKAAKASSKGTLRTIHVISEKRSSKELIVTDIRPSLSVQFGL